MAKETIFDELVNLEKQDYITNCYEFECLKCNRNIEVDSGVILRGCFHEFCLKCLQKYISTINTCVVVCPYENCTINLEDREVRTIGGVEAYKRYIDICAQLVSISQPDFKVICCETPGCTGWTVDNNLRGKFSCQKCIGQRQYQKDAYQSFVNADNVSFHANYEQFECDICMNVIRVNEGVMLRECTHTYCLECMKDHIKSSTGGMVKCPGCELFLEDREVRGISGPQLFAAYIFKCNRQAAAHASLSAYCKTINCNGWATYEDKNVPFKCLRCNAENCLKCEAIHENMSCEKYKDSIQFDETTKMIQNMVDKGECMLCPACKSTIFKHSGCDFIVCAVCELEICWATKQRRWGPGGRGDTSGGCKCEVNGIKCHPNCHYCHGHGHDRYG